MVERQAWLLWAATASSGPRVADRLPSAAPSSVQSAGRPRRGRARAASLSRMRLKATRPRPASHASPRPSGAMCAPHVGRREGGREGQISDRSVTFGLGWVWHCPHASVWKRRVGAACRWPGRRRRDAPLQPERLLFSFASLAELFGKSPSYCLSMQRLLVSFAAVPPPAGITGGCDFDRRLSWRQRYLTVLVDAQCSAT